MTVTGWKLDPEDRALLLVQFPPRWPDVIADHVTLNAHADAATPLPLAAQAEIVGGIDDGEGLQAMVVTVDGRTRRPDGSIYHITWSLDRRRGREPIDSNRVLAERGWQPIERPVPIRIRPARWD